MTQIHPTARKIKRRGKNEEERERKGGKTIERDRGMEQGENATLTGKLDKDRKCLSHLVPCSSFLTLARGAHGAIVQQLEQKRLRIDNNGIFLMGLL